MNCSACQHTNPPGARFCNACGEALAIVCGQCNQTNPANSRFCNGCGQNLEAGAAEAEPGREADRLTASSDPRSYTPSHLADRILNQKGALEGERRHVTVLFADLAESSELARQIGDPEGMHTLLDRAFQLILAQVHRVEGTINQFTGDGVMALFGAPLALEDAPRRALMAALGVQRDLQALDREVQEQYGRPFQMRIGIHSGPVVVGTIGDDLRMDYTAVGDTTNLAARLESLAAPGKIVISEATARQVEGFFDVIELPPATLKGQPGPTQAFEVVEALAVEHRVDAASASADGLTSFQGRELELDLLDGAFEQAKSGRGQVAFIVGEAGLGKSRLVHEFRRRLKERNEANTWVEGRCASYAQNTPFYAVADAVRRISGIDERDDEAGALAKISAREEALGGGLSETLPFLRVLLSLPSLDSDVDALDAMSRRSEMSKALHKRLMRASENHPEIIVIEDLHWIDAATEEFLCFLAETLAAVPVLLILTHRPGYEHPLGDRSYHTRVQLRPLSEEATSSMVGSVLETTDLPPALRELIATKAEGNPLFIEEVTASLLEEGVVALAQGRIELTQELANVAVPDRIQDVLMARLDRLPPEPKRAIQIASIIGREFAMRLLQRIHEVGGGLDEIVGELRALELIYEKATHPELAYIFKHALTHEVAYESVLIARRKALHRLVGTAIEELYRDRLPEHYEALAHHFAASEAWEQALHYHELAAEKSAASYANHAAIEHSQRAVSIAGRLGNVSAARILVLHRRIGECGFMISDFALSAAGYRAAAELAEGPEVGQRADASLLWARAAFSSLWNHDYDLAIEREDRSLALAAESGSAAGEAFALLSRDERGLIHGQGQSDSEQADHAIDLARRCDAPDVLVTAYGHLAQRAEWRCDYRQAISLSDEAIALAEAGGTPGAALFASWFQSMACVCMGEYGRGLEILHSGIALCDHIGDRAIKSRLLNTLGWAHAEFGAHREAAEFNRAATEIARESVELGLVAGAPELYANGAINLASNLMSLGQPDEAAAQLEDIQRQYDNDPDPWMRWRWSTHLLHHQALLALSTGDLDRALALSKQDLAASEASTSQKLIARSLELSGRIDLMRDETEGANVSLQESLRIATDLEHPSVSARAASLLAEVARRKGDRSGAVEQQARVRALFRAVSPTLSNVVLRQGYLGMGERMTEDPLSIFR